MLPKLHGKHVRKGGPRQSPDSEPDPTPRRWLRTDETAALIGVSRMTIYRLHACGRLPSFKMPGLGIRVDREKLGEMLERATERAG